ncbi:hypothetical protein [Kosmotoga sp.]|uniref:glycosyltransferase family 2 protein n=1 Tax=Kosmotoga sp. TaxID=1955248 RepID=UPI0025BBBC23|nr:hypothetical protein [Kosmotoga sp.]
MLDNLLEFEEIKRGEIPVRIIGIANRKDLRDKVEDLLESYLKEYSNKMELKLCSYSWLNNLKKKLGEREIDNFFPIEPDSYSQIRNLCLLAALETKSDIGIFLDDDELLTDKDYFNKSEEGMYSLAEDNGTILGKAGYYKQDRQNYSRFWELKWWPKDVSFNETFERLIREKPRFKATMVALGGNMVISKDVMKSVCFDPYVNRGEDMDYVFNARMLGYRFYFDPELFIEHYPPEKKTPDWKKAREDIYRFLYLREKYRGHLQSEKVQKIAFEEFLPYPGIFMRDDLEDRIIEHSRMMAMRYLSENDKEAFNACMENAKIPFLYKKNADIINDFLKTTNSWREITQNI